MITNGKTNKIGTMSKLPNMSNTIIGWFQDITFGVVTRAVVDYESVKSIQTIKTKGVVQPYQPTELDIQVAGSRSWNWLMIHCLPDLNLEENSYIYYKDIQYKVMKKYFYEEYGYYEYVICEGYENG
ncbi:MAG: hypothetical protein J6S67_11215 [Methanobrevibacter sp.]|nr:hypothetical protein [Methanobrevibacter sp.]